MVSKLPRLSHCAGSSPARGRLALRWYHDRSQAEDIDEKTACHKLCVCALGLALNATSWAGDGDKSGEGETIRGVIAGVASEGETVIDFRTNRGMTVEAAYITVIGSPTNTEHRNKDTAGGNTAADREGNHDRDNVYVLWLSPKTKFEQCWKDSAGKEQKKSVTLDRLEVGDRVEVRFAAQSNQQPRRSTSK